MAISSNSLFHFTSKADYLISILENGFYPRYCFEEKENHILLEIAIPMVCFCDLPLSNVVPHLSFYGNYGIGFTKEWAISKGINPVLYISKNSRVCKCLDEIAKNFLEIYWKSKGSLKNGLLKDEDVIKLRDEFGIYISDTVDFTKPIEGKMYHEGKEFKKYFYDEREWRYIPILETTDSNYRLSKDDFKNSVKLAQSNSQLSKKCTLNFCCCDIKYIIVNSDDDIYSMIEAINEIYNKESVKNRQMLCSRILTIKQIKEDF